MIKKNPATALRMRIELIAEGLRAVYEELNEVYEEIYKIEKKLIEQ